MSRCQFCGYRWIVHPHVRCEMNYRDQRRAERRSLFEERLRKEAAEARRVESLSLYMRIDELDVGRDVKDVLLLMCERAGIQTD